MIYQSNNYKPAILVWIEKMLTYANKKGWDKTYWVFDIHGVISKPDYRRDRKKIDYYKYAKETLQLISEKHKDIVLIIFSSSYPKEMEIYMNTFKEDKINFKYVNENPEIDSSKGDFGYYKEKFYFNVLFEDKAGFDPKTDWEYIYNYLKNEKATTKNN